MSSAAPKSYFPFRSEFDTAVLIYAISLIALASAWFIEYQLDISPCEICYIGRWPHYAILTLGFLFFIPFRPVMSRTVLAAIGLASGIGIAVSIFHSGVEWSWWPGLTSCSSSDRFDPASLNLSNLDLRLSSTRIIRCDEPAMTIVGLSLANLNGIVFVVQFILSLIGVTMLLRALSATSNRNSPEGIC